MPWKKDEQGIPYFLEPEPSEIALSKEGNVLSSSAPDTIKHMGKLTREQIEALDKLKDRSESQEPNKPKSNYVPAHNQNGQRLRARRVR